MLVFGCLLDHKPLGHSWTQGNGGGGGSASASTSEGSSGAGSCRAHRLAAPDLRRPRRAGAHGALALSTVRLGAALRHRDDRRVSALGWMAVAELSTGSLSSTTSIVMLAFRPAGASGTGSAVAWGPSRDPNEGTALGRRARWPGRRRWLALAALALVCLWNLEKPGRRSTWEAKTSLLADTLPEDGSRPASISAGRSVLAKLETEDG